PYLLISYHISHPFFKDGGQFTIPFSSGNYNCRQAGVLIVAHQLLDLNWSKSANTSANKKARMDQVIISRVNRDAL
ncbi:MAG: hypothetical protein AB1487_04030, partial [Thermodesulfobacteriota bacterium]